jgi:V/A-type H+-transporting ATPase subunit K
VNNEKENLKLRINQSLIVIFTVMAIIFTVFCASAFSQPADSGETEHSQANVVKTENAQPEIAKYALIAAAVAFGLGAIGAGVAISHVGAAAMGAVAEKPQIAGQALIFVALAEGIVIFGFITALMILSKM